MIHRCGGINRRAKELNMKKLAVVIFAVFLLIPVQGVFAQFFADIEAGAAVTGYNDVQIPSDTGTEFSLADETPAGVVPVIRIRAGYTVAEKHRVWLLAAPLRFRGSGRLSKPVTFDGVTFADNEKVESIYRFDSYRVSYQWEFFRNDDITLGAGLTAKVRSADITLMGESGFARSSDLGVVPLINFRVQWTFADDLSLLFEGDALWSPYGRAEDVLLALQWHPSDKAAFRLGYRILEGGSDGGGDVYTFALIHYGTVGFSYSL